MIDFSEPDVEGKHEGGEFETSDRKGRSRIGFAILTIKFVCRSPVVRPAFGRASAIF